jgi:hypothetical protein
LEISQYQARRLGLPKTAKDALKVAKTVIITGAIDCLYGAFADKLASIPSFKNLPVLKMAGKAKEDLKELILKEMDKFIDGLRRARRNLILRRRMGILDDIGNVVKKIPDVVVDKGKGIADAADKAAAETKKKAEQVTEAAKKAAEAAGKGVVEGAEAVGEVVVTIKDLAKKLSGLVGAALLKALSNIACPVVARIVHHGLDIALKFAGFPPLPMCLHDAILAGCKKGVELAFKRQRILRRLSSLKRELEQF